MSQVTDGGAGWEIGLGAQLPQSAGQDEQVSCLEQTLSPHRRRTSFKDPRLFGRMQPTRAELLHQLPVIRALGPDLLVDGLTPASLQRALGPTKVAIKVALMDQSRLAGLGNIHAAEALFRAGIHPSRPTRSLAPDEWRTLCRAVHKTLVFGLSQQDEEEIQYVEEPGAENPFLIYGRAHEPCVKCGATVRSIAQGGRTTHFCPRCQPRRRRR